MHVGGIYQQKPFSVQLFDGELKYEDPPYYEGGCSKFERIVLFDIAACFHLVDYRVRSTWRSQGTC